MEKLPSKQFDAEDLRKEMPFETLAFESEKPSFFNANNDNAVEEVSSGPSVENEVESTKEEWLKEPSGF